MYCYTNLPPVYQDVSWLNPQKYFRALFSEPINPISVQSQSSYTDGLRLGSACSSVRGAGDWGWAFTITGPTRGFPVTVVE